MYTQPKMAGVGKGEQAYLGAPSKGEQSYLGGLSKGEQSYPGALSKVEQSYPAPLSLLTKGDPTSKFLPSEETALIRQIEDIHAPDVGDINVRPLLAVIEDILKRATINVDPTLLVTPTTTQVETMDDKLRQTTLTGMPDALSFVIDRVACEMACKCGGEGDSHHTTLSLLHMLSKFPWEAKLVLSLAAFALSYGEFWLLAQIYSVNPLAKSMAILKQVPTTIEQFGRLKPRFDTLNTLIKSILELTQIIVEIKELPTTYTFINREIPEYATATESVRPAVYWAIRSIVYCTTQILSLSSMGQGQQYSALSADYESSMLPHRIQEVLRRLKELNTDFRSVIERRKETEDYKYLDTLFKMTHLDNMPIYRAFFYNKDDPFPLVEGAFKRVGLEVLRLKNVLLLISGLDIAPEELAILEGIYTDYRQSTSRMESLFEVLWMPIVDRSPNSKWNTEQAIKRRIEELRLNMKWFSVYDPLAIKPVVINFVKNKWQFQNKTILVVLDPKGVELSPNAMHMMLIWEGQAFPFTRSREFELWETESWRLDFLVSGIDPTMVGWVRDGKFIILYGGDDIEWIQNFTRRAKAVGLAEKLPLEMAYVGKSSNRDQVRRANTHISQNNLSYCWPDNNLMSLMWFFWTRLECMMLSKIQLEAKEDQDLVMQGVKKLLSYDRIDRGWALFARGSTIVVSGHGATVLQTMTEYETMWQQHIITKGFDRALKDHHDMRHLENIPCSRLEFSATIGKLPERMRCPECSLPMDLHMTFLCCHKDRKALAAYESGTRL